MIDSAYSQMVDSFLISGVFNFGRIPLILSIVNFHGIGQTITSESGENLQVPNFGLEEMFPLILD